MKGVRFATTATMPIIQATLGRLAELGVLQVTVTFHDRSARNMTLTCLVSPELNDELKAEFN
jgi:hypothetical protein